MYQNSLHFRFLLPRIGNCRKDKWRQLVGIQLVFIMSYIALEIEILRDGGNDFKPLGPYTTVFIRSSSAIKSWKILHINLKCLDFHLF